jgi:glutamate N-acetyltransferase/amino-acid N-acetyltransferase
VVKPVPAKARHHVSIPDDSFPQGYSLTGVHCGVKKNASVLDLAVILSTSPRPTAAAACFTRNAFKAAPVLVSNDVLEKSAGRARAIVTNSGCANAVTGKQGLEDAWAMVKATDALLKSQDTNDTLVMSTGVIGQNLPISKILSGISSLIPPSLGSDFAAWERAAKAFMTTDTFPKLRARTFSLGGQTFRMAGMDKGAGMIHPDMGPPTDLGQLHATLLSCILTDAAVSPKALQSALTYAVDRSYNSISVDGDMSTNDTIIVLANGAAARENKELDEHDPLFPAFRDELTSFAAELAQLVVRDGEGATKFVTVSVEVGHHGVLSSISSS